METKEYVQSLRLIADWFEANPEVPIPHDADVFYLYSLDTRKEMEMVARIFGSCEKEYTAGLFKLKKKFGEIEMCVVATREQVCKRKVVGAKLVPEQVIPAHNVDIVEWECFDTPLLSAPKEPIPIDAPLAQVIRHDQQVARESEVESGI